MKSLQEQILEAWEEMNTPAGHILATGAPPLYVQKDCWTIARLEKELKIAEHDARNEKLGNAFHNESNRLKNAILEEKQAEIAAILVKYDINP